jgi:hypothetical protein
LKSVFTTAPEEFLKGEGLLPLDGTKAEGETEEGWFLLTLGEVEGDGIGELFSAISCREACVSRILSGRLFMTGSALSLNKDFITSWVSRGIHWYVAHECRISAFQKGWVRRVLPFPNRKRLYLALVRATFILRMSSKKPIALPPLTLPEITNK